MSYIYKETLTEQKFWSLQADVETDLQGITCWEVAQKIPFSWNIYVLRCYNEDGTKTQDIYFSKDYIEEKGEYTYDIYEKR